MTAYHLTPMKNRLSIQRYGLYARDTAEHHYPEPEASQNHGIEAVYVGARETAATHWAGREAIPGTPHWALFEVDVAGLPVEADPYSYPTAGSWRRVLCDIPPERVRYVGRVNADGEVRRATA